MRWEDERYVKLYTRDTLTTRRLGWEGRAVLWELIRKVDRAGIAEIGEEEPIAALSALTGVPLAVCRVAWPRLVGTKSPVVTLRESDPRAIFIRNFMPAQEAKQSDRARQEKHREMARAREMATSYHIANSEEVSRGVVTRDDLSQGVTKRHDRSHAVTPSLAVPRTKYADSSQSGESERREFTACESVDNSIPSSPTSSPNPEPEDPLEVSKALEQARLAAERRRAAP